MNIAIFFIAAIVTYLVCSLNSAIILGKLIYHKDIRQEGSGNAGFTNFKRAFGMKWAWFVFLFDFSKAIVCEIIFAVFFKRIFGDAFWNVGIAYTAIFGMFGHCYPIWHQFKGGKGFLVCLSTLWIINWICGLITTVVMVALVLITKLMSLSTILAMILGAVLIPFIHEENILTVIFFAFCTLFMIYRHKANIVRLFKGEESKTYFFKKKNKSNNQ